MPHQPRAAGLRRRFRSAISGRFVPLTTAERDPDTTMAEEIPDADRRVLTAMLERDSAVAAVQQLADVLERALALPNPTASTIHDARALRADAALALAGAAKYRQEGAR